MNATRFPKIRLLMHLRAVLVPGLFLAAFLAYARSMVIVGIGLAGLAFCLFLGFAGPQEELRLDLPPPQQQGFERLRFLLGRAVHYLIVLWLITQPELGAFLHRVNHGMALWDWRLIVPAILLAALGMISGLRRASALTDRQIYDWLEEK